MPYCSEVISLVFEILQLYFFILHSSKSTTVNMQGLHFNINLNNVVLKGFTTSKGGCLGMFYKFFFYSI